MKELRLSICANILPCSLQEAARATSSTMPPDSWSESQRVTVYDSVVSCCVDMYRIPSAPQAAIEFRVRLKQPETICNLAAIAS